MSYVPNHKLIQQVERYEREEREARLALADAREEAKSGAPHGHHELIQKLEAEWKHALERLHHARQSGQDKP
jgi:hypothetical protein